MTTEPWDLTHTAGDTLAQGIRINNMQADGSHTPADLTGWVAAAICRDLRTKAVVPGLSATLSNQTTDPGVLTVQATADTTALWLAGPSLVYDVQITETATGFIRTVLSGRIMVRAQVTS